MLNPHFVAGEHGLFGSHESEDIRTIFNSVIGHFLANIDQFCRLLLARNINSQNIFMQKYCFPK